MACAIKEEHSFVGDRVGPINVEMRADGRPVTYDVSEQVRAACEALIPEIVENVGKLIQGFPPEDQDTVLKNIIVAGGGSRIRGMSITN